MTATSRLAITGVVGFSAAVNLVVALWAVVTRPALNTDFLAFFSFPRFAAAHPVAQIYQAAKLQDFQQALYPGFHSFYPFLYPPTFLLVGWWLKFCSFPVAQGIWTAAGALLLLLACWVFFAPARRFAMVAMLASPASLINFMTGETAYFTSALLLFGCGTLRRFPVWAGVAFGLLTLKPQLGVLVPFALVACGQWRAIWAAAAVTAGLIALSCLAFPPGLWLVWARTLPVYQAQYFSGSGLNLNILVTPAANLVALGASPAAAWAVQLAASVAVACGVFWCFRRARWPLALAALLCGGFLAVPHAYAYDTIPLSAALALLPARGWAKPTVLLLAAAVYLAPLLLLSPWHHWFFYAPLEMLLFGAIIGLALTDSKRAELAHERSISDTGV
jgi:hypothetical protein